MHITGNIWLYKLMHITGYNWLYKLMHITDGYNCLYKLMHITGYNWLYNLMHNTGYNWLFCFSCWGSIRDSFWSLVAWSSWTQVWYHLKVIFFKGTVYVILSYLPLMELKLSSIVTEASQIVHTSQLKIFKFLKRKALVLDISLMNVYQGKNVVNSNSFIFRHLRNVYNS